MYNLTLDADNVYYANCILVENCADALALTWAAPVRLQDGFRWPGGGSSQRALSDFDPLADSRTRVGKGDFDPLDTRR